MKQEAHNDKKFEELVEKRRRLSAEKKTSIHKVSAKDLQLKDIIKNFHEEGDYEKRMKLK